MHYFIITQSRFSDPTRGPLYSLDFDEIECRSDQDPLLDIASGCQDELESDDGLEQAWIENQVLPLTKAGEVVMRLLDYQIPKSNKVVIKVIRQQGHPETIVDGESSGLSYTLIAYDILQHNLSGKRYQAQGDPVFATGQVLDNGEVVAVNGIYEKLCAVLGYIANHGIDSARFLYPTECQLQFEDAKKRLTREQTALLDRLQDKAVSSVQEAIQSLSLSDTVKSYQLFLGLNSYRFEDQARYSGRDDTIKSGLKRLELALQQQSSVVLLLDGLNGSGKSSLAMAGLMPAIVRKPEVLSQPGKAVDHVVYPRAAHSLTTLPLRSLTGFIQALLHFLNQEVKLDIEVDPEKIIDFPNPLFDAYERWHSRHPSHCIVFVLDQLEEVFQWPGAEQWDDSETIPDTARLFHFLNEFIAQCSGVIIIATLRSEFTINFKRAYTIKELHPETPLFEQALVRFKDETSTELPVSNKLSAKQWPQVVSKQLHWAGVAVTRSVTGLESGKKYIEASAVEELVTDAVKDEHGLPLVSFCLQSLYERALKRKDPDGPLLIMWQDYVGEAYLKTKDPKDKIGLGMIAEQAESVLAKAVSSNSHEDADLKIMDSIARMFFQQFVAWSSERQRLTKKRVDRDYLHEHVKQVFGDAARQNAFHRFVEGMLACHLVKLDYQGAPSYQIVHDALIQCWYRVKQWFDKDYAFIQWYERTDHLAWLWKNSQGELIRSENLRQEAEAYLDSRKAMLSVDLIEYIGASKRYHDELKAEATRRRNMVLGAVSLAFVIVSVLAVRIYYQSINLSAEIVERERVQIAQHISTAKLQRKTGLYEDSLKNLLYPVSKGDVASKIIGWKYTSEMNLPSVSTNGEINYDNSFFIVKGKEHSIEVVDFNTQEVVYQVASDCEPKSASRPAFSKTSYDLYFVCSDKLESTVFKVDLLKGEREKVYSSKIAFDWVFGSLYLTESGQNESKLFSINSPSQVWKAPFEIIFPYWIKEGRLLQAYVPSQGAIRIFQLQDDMLSPLERTNIDLSIVSRSHQIHPSGKKLVYPHKSGNLAVYDLDSRTEIETPLPSGFRSWIMYDDFLLAQDGKKLLKFHVFSGETLSIDLSNSLDDSDGMRGMAFDKNTNMVALAYQRKLLFASIDAINDAFSKGKLSEGEIQSKLSSYEINKIQSLDESLYVYSSDDSAIVDIYSEISPDSEPYSLRLPVSSEKVDFIEMKRVGSGRYHHAYVRAANQPIYSVWRENDTPISRLRSAFLPRVKSNTITFERVNATRELVRNLIMDDKRLDSMMLSATSRNYLVQVTQDDSSVSKSNIQITDLASSTSASIPINGLVCQVEMNEREDFIAVRTCGETNKTWLYELRRLKATNQLEVIKAQFAATNAETIQFSGDYLVSATQGLSKLEFFDLSSLESTQIETTVGDLYPTVSGLFTPDAIALTDGEYLVSQDGNVAISNHCANGRIPRGLDCTFIWDLRKRAPIQIPAYENHYVNNLRMIRENRLLVHYRPKGINVRDLNFYVVYSLEKGLLTKPVKYEENGPIFPVKGSEYLIATTFSEDGGFRFRRINIATGENKYVPINVAGQFMRLFSLKKEKWFGLFLGKSIEIYDVESLERVHSLATQSIRVNSDTANILKISPDGKLAMIIDANGIPQLRSLETDTIVLNQQEILPPGIVELEQRNKTMGLDHTFAFSSDSKSLLINSNPRVPCELEQINDPNLAPICLPTQHQLSLYYGNDCETDKLFKKLIGYIEIDNPSMPFGKLPLYQQIGKVTDQCPGISSILGNDR